MVNSRLQLEIDTYFKKLFPNSKILRFATVSSFCQQRIKISYRAFYQSILALNKFFYTEFKYKTFYGYRVVAIDGSIYTLPSSDELIQKFGRNLFSSQQKWLKAQVSLAFDVLNHICLDAHIDAYKTSERKMAIDHLDNISEESLFLFDRGYFCKTLIAKLNKQGAQYCFRVSKIANSIVKQFCESDQQDYLTDLNYGTHRITIRLVKIKLNTGETEILLTSLLNSTQFSVLKLKRLYHLRWQVEEAYKDFKHTLAAENFTSKKANAINQEFYARILMYNLSMMSCKKRIDQYANTSSKKHKYQTNKRALLGLIKQYSAELFFKEESYIKLKIEQITYLATKESVPIRSGRYYHRIKTNKAKKKSFRAYVPVI